MHVLILRSAASLHSAVTRAYTLASMITAETPTTLLSTGMKTYQSCINNDVRACRFSFWNQRKRVKRRILTPKPAGINEAMAFSVCLLLLAAIISGTTAQLQGTSS